jgi:hypothetical protein
LSLLGDGKFHTTIMGRAQASGDVFDFTIEPSVPAGFVLHVDFAGGAARAGQWPTVEKAQQIAQRIADRVSNGAAVSWDCFDDLDEASGMAGPAYLPVDAVQQA